MMFLLQLGHAHLPRQLRSAQVPAQPRGRGHDVRGTAWPRPEDRERRPRRPRAVPRPTRSVFSARADASDRAGPGPATGACPATVRGSVRPRAVGSGAPRSPGRPPQHCRGGSGQEGHSLGGHRAGQGWNQPARAGRAGTGRAGIVRARMVGLGKVGPGDRAADGSGPGWSRPGRSGPGRSRPGRRARTVRPGRADGRMARMARRAARPVERGVPSGSSPESPERVTAVTGGSVLRPARARLVAPDHAARQAPTSLPALRRRARAVLAGPRRVTTVLAVPALAVAGVPVTGVTEGSGNQARPSPDPDDRGPVARNTVTRIARARTPARRAPHSPGYRNAGSPAPGPRRIGSP